MNTAPLARAHNKLLAVGCALSLVCLKHVQLCGTRGICCNRCKDKVSPLGGAGNNNNPESEQQTWLGTVFSDMTWEPNACIKTGNAASTKRALLLHLLA